MKNTLKRTGYWNEGYKETIYRSKLRRWKKFEEEWNSKYLQTMENEQKCEDKRWKMENSLKTVRED